MEAIPRHLDDQLTSAQGSAIGDDTLSAPQSACLQQDIINASNREQPGLMLLSKNELLRKVIEDGLLDKTKPRDRLAIFLKLNDLIQQMMQNHEIDSGLEQQAHEFLKQGPPWVKVKSRFTATVSYETKT